MKTNLLILTTALLLSSCGIYKPYKQPKMNTENFYGENIPASEETASIADLNWDELFTDKYLQELIKTALDNNTDLKIARLRIEQAEASTMSAKLSFLPSLSLSPQGSMTGYDGSSAIKTYQLPATASWEPDLFGKQTNILKQKKASLEQSEYYKQGVQTQLISTVANSYYTLLMLDSQLDISEKTAVLWEENINVMRLLKRSGQSNEAAITQAEANKYSVEATIEDLRRQITEVENTLCSVLGFTPRKLERGLLSLQSFPEEIEIGVPLQLLSNRPDVMVAEASLKQAFYYTNEARSYFYPSLTLSGNIGWTNSGGVMVSNPGALLWNAVAGLTQPIFDKGVNKARLKIAKAQQEEAKLTFHQTLLDAGAEVNSALAYYQSAHNKVEIYNKQVKALESTVTDTQLLMRYGSSTYLEVLTAQQTLLQAQLNQVGNCFDEIQSVITLYKSLGGGRTI